MKINDINDEYNTFFFFFNIKFVDEEKIYSFVEQALKDFCKLCDNPAVWCNGVHTKMLMSDFVFEMRKVKYIIDKEKESDSGYITITPNEIDKTTIDGVIISSYKYKEEIQNEINTNHKGLKYLDLYECLRKNGINIQSEYYQITHPYSKYKRINSLKIKNKNSKDKEEKTRILYELVKEFILIKDFNNALYYAEELSIYDSSFRKMAYDIKRLRDIYIDTLKDINNENDIIIFYDGSVFDSFEDGSFRKTSHYLKENGVFYNNCYSVSTSTYESLVPALSENFDLRTKYFLSNAVEYSRFCDEIFRQGRKLFFITDGVEYIKDSRIFYINKFQTITEKLFEFCELCKKERNAVVFIGVLWESHFSFPSPYTTEKIVANGTGSNFDLLYGEKKYLTDYKLQYIQALNYLDDVLYEFIKHVGCNILFFTDHGNVIPNYIDGVNELIEENFICSEKLIHVPLAMICRGISPKIEEQLCSESDLNEMIISFINKKTWDPPQKHYIKVQRSTIYNPDMKHLFEKLNFSKASMAFEGFVTDDGYKLVLFEDGSRILYKVDDDTIVYNQVKERQIFDMVYQDITVYEVGM